MWYGESTLSDSFSFSLYYSYFKGLIGNGYVRAIRGKGMLEPLVCKIVAWLEASKNGGFSFKVSNEAISKTSENRINWLEMKRGMFSVKSFYFPFKKMLFWIYGYQQKWDSLWYRILIIDQMKKRGWTMVNRFFFSVKMRKNWQTTFCFIIKKTKIV